MTAPTFDLVRLADVRDAHAYTVTAYRLSSAAVRDAAVDAARARQEAPPLPEMPQKMRRYSLPEGQQLNAMPKPEPLPNSFYQQPLEVLQAATQEQLKEARVDERALARIVAAEIKLARLRAAHEAKAAAVHRSAALMSRVNEFARLHRL